MVGRLYFAPLLAALALITGCAERPEAIDNAARSDDVGQIYRAFLDSWTGKEKSPVNVSKEAQPPSSEDIAQFTACAGGWLGPRWVTATAVDDLGGITGELPYVRVVDPENWKPQDPGELIARGESVKSAVDSGFAHGLLTFSAITFDASHETAAFTYSFVCGRLCGNGAPVIFRKTKNGWVQSKARCGGWIS